MGRSSDHITQRFVLAGLLILLFVAAVSCGADDESVAKATNAASSEPAARSAAGSGLTLTIGDISDEPAKKIERFLPLANYLVQNLSESGYDDGDVMIAATIEEMTSMMADGRVDVYMDSFYPALLVSEDGGGVVSLIRSKEGASSYEGLIVVRNDSGIATTQDLAGRMIAAEEQYSTSGFALQTSELLKQGMQVVEVAEPEDGVAAGEVGLWFSRDEENSVFALETGRVDAAFLSDQDFEELDSPLLDSLRIVGKTTRYPRQLVVIRAGLSEGVRERIKALLIDLVKTESGLELLQHTKSDEFISLTDADRNKLAGIQGALIPIKSIVAK